MNIEITWTITAIIGVSSFMSPIFVAIINNRHQRKMRKMELEYDMATKKLYSLYDDKKVAFTNFLLSSGKVLTDNTLQDTLVNFYKHSQTAILFSSEENQKLIGSFSSDILNSFNDGISSEKRDVLKTQLLTLAFSLNRELSTLQADIYCPNRK